MKKFFNLFIFVIVVLGALCLSVTTATSEMNKGSTEITVLAFNVDPSTSVDMMIEDTMVEPYFLGTISISQDVKENGRIEQGDQRSFTANPESSINVIMTSDAKMQVEKEAQWRTGDVMNLTNTTHVLSILDAQWRNSNLNLSSTFRNYGWISESFSAVPSVFPNLSVSELSNETGNSLDCANLTALNESIAMPSIWLISLNSINFAGATIPDNAMQNSPEK